MDSVATEPQPVPPELLQKIRRVEIRARHLGRIPGSRELPWLLLVFAIALTLRLLWVAFAVSDPNDGRFDDSVFYHVAASGLVRGYGYINAWSFLPTAQWPPGYPFFLAALYFPFGPTVVGAKLANAALGAATCLLVYGVGLRLFDRWTARIGALLLAVFPGQIFFSSLLWSETLFTFLLWLALFLIVRSPTQPTGPGARWIVVAGVVLGMATLVRQVSLAIPAAMLLYWGLTGGEWRQAARRTLLLTAAMLSVILPWSARNYLVLDSPVLISSSAGGNFWIGHHEGASGGMDSPAPLVAKYGPLSKPGAEVAVSDAGFREGLKFMTTHPEEELRRDGLGVSC